MKIEHFDYFLPKESIAQHPSQRRDASRLMVVNRRTQAVMHGHFRELPEFLATLAPGAAMFRNTVRVLKARLKAQRSQGGAVECFLLRPTQDTQSWWCLLRPGKKLPVGACFGVEDIFSAKVLEKSLCGEALVRFETSLSVPQLAAQIGELPLPPYIERPQGPSVEDELRYNTVYAQADKTRAVAAPTAGLHFTPELIRTLEDKGHPFYNLTLDVGLGTFAPIQSAHIEDHTIHIEPYEIPQATRLALHSTQRPRLAVGTTTLRSLESYHRQTPQPEPGDYHGQAGIYIFPPFSAFHVEGLLTNFHLPRSTLLCLVSAFLTPGSTEGVSWLQALYAEALSLDYRFYSYGDAMLIV